MPSRGQVTGPMKVMIGFAGGAGAGLIFYWLSEQFPNAGSFFLSSTVPVYLSWKVSFLHQTWVAFFAYYVTIGGIIGWLASRDQNSSPGKIVVFLAALLAMHYLTTFLIAHEITRVKF